VPPQARGIDPPTTERKVKITPAAIRRLNLGALSLPGVRKDLGPGTDAEALRTESGGNPFYLRQLARSRQATEVGGGPDTGEVLVEVLTAISDELALLDRDTRRVLSGRCGGRRSVPNRPGGRRVGAR